MEHRDMHTAKTNMTERLTLTGWSDNSEERKIPLHSPEERKTPLYDSEEENSSLYSSEEKKSPLYQRLLLTASLAGNEACLSFQQLYEVPVLQMMGVPVFFVSFYPVVAGPLAVVMMALEGYISDRGSHPRQRRVCLLVFNSMVTLLGSLLVVAGLLALVVKGDARTGAVDSAGRLVSTAGGGRPWAALPSRPPAISEEEWGVDKNYLTIVEDNQNNTYRDDTGVDKNHSAIGEDDRNTTGIGVKEGGTDPGDVTESSLLSLPTPALLGLVGFCLMDIGYDMNIPATRSLALSCSPPGDRVSIIVLGVVMAALGGCLNCVISFQDMSALLGLSGEHGSLVTKCAAQMCVCCVMLLLFLTATVVSALLAIRKQDAAVPCPPLGGEKKTLKGEKKKHYGTLDNDNRNTDTDLEDGCVDNLDNNSLHVVDRDSIDLDSENNILEPDNSDSDLDIDPNTPVNNETTGQPEVGGRSTPRRKNFNKSFIESTCSNIMLLKSEQQRDGGGNKYNSLDMYSELVSSSENMASTTKLCCGVKKPERQKMNLAIACAIAYLGCSVFYSYNMYASNFLGTEVKGGNSLAPKGSASLQAYEAGVNMAAGGMLAFFVSYIVNSSLQGKIVPYLGMKANFCLSHALMAAAILALVLTREVPVFYTACVLYGCQRTALLTTPFVIAENYTRHKGEKADGSSSVGRVMALVTVMIPLNFCTLYLISGPLIDATGSEGAPLLVASGATCLAAAIFTLYRP